MKKQNTIKWFKPLFALIFVLGIGATVLVFSSEPENEESEIKEEVVTKANPVVKRELSEQMNILDSLNTLKVAYDVAILEKP